MRVADELLLLAYSDEGSVEVSNLDLGLAGAVLLELAISGRIDLRDGRLTVADPAPTGDAVLDSALSAIGADPRARKPEDWVGRLGDGLRDRLLDGLVVAGVLRREEDRVLWVFPRTRYPEANGAVETDARARLAAALHRDAPVEARTAALAALVTALGMEGKAVADRPRKEVSAGLKAAAERGLADDGWAAEGVRKAVEALQVATMVAITAATTATTMSANNN